MLKLSYMALSYNEIGILYNSTEVTYNGARIDFSIPSSDQVNISEEVVVRLDLEPIGVEDTIEISENFVDTGETLGNITVYDTLNSLEEIITSGLLYLSVWDNMEVSEDIKLESVLFISTYDDLNTSEDVVNSGQNYLATIDSLNLSEYLETVTPLLGPINRDDQVAISEDNILELRSYVSKYEEISITEQVSLESFRFSPSDQRPVGKGRSMKPKDGKLAGFF